MINVVEKNRRVKREDILIYWNMGVHSYVHCLINKQGQKKIELERTVRQKKITWESSTGRKSQCKWKLTFHIEY
jgi:hypothetical protein